MDLSRSVVVHCHSYLPICPTWFAHGPITCQIRQHLGQTLRNPYLHIFETTGWMYTIRSSMELSRPVVVQHQGYLTLTLDFQGQILKMLYVGNGNANSWNEISGMGGPINME